jgi:hypothetical protein
MIIGLSGYAQSGKDTVAKYLVEHHGFERVAFADPIRDFLLEVDPILENGLHMTTVVKDLGWELAKKQAEVRRLLQVAGVAARKHIDTDLWVIAAIRKMNEVGKQYVITDVRFQNEAVMIKQSGGHLWRIERDGVGPVNDHISEHDLKDWEFDVVLHNNSNFDSLNLAIQVQLMRAA